jgi:hypothetical protein
MIENLPTMTEVIGYALTWWAIGFVAGKKLITFVRLAERM